ncbi:MAG: stage II sporulation protein R [Clostridia bacterium]|nr:stage II sporulation protein R [Clostridia bacterium]
MKKILILCVCVCFIFIVLGVLPIHGEAQIYDSVLRLHVVANSDSEEDQALKLKVRDRVISAVNDAQKECSDIGEARIAVEAQLEDIAEAAADEIALQGYDYSVEVRLGEEEYPTKNYASLCFPSGKYLSLQVRIGDAAGQNWWCVLFPPLCLDAATSANEDAFIAVGFTPEQYKIITQTDNPKYEARFKILELIEGMGE